MAIRSLIRERFFPHLWCPGCGHGHVLNAMLHSVDDLGYDPSSLVMVSGIGCSARIAGYVDFHTMHTLHGRALAFATGIKMSRPDLHVIVPMGDGDALAIGGNHFIHAARRNIKLTAIVMNNRIYGMTGGQYSPLSGIGVSRDDGALRQHRPRVRHRAARPRRGGDLRGADDHLPHARDDLDLQEGAPA